MTFSTNAGSTTRGCLQSRRTAEAGQRQSIRTTQKPCRSTGSRASRAVRRRIYWRVDTDEIRSSEELYRILELDRDTPLTLARVADRVHPEDITSLNEQIAQARRSGIAFDTEMRLKVPDGTFKYLRMTAYGARAREGELEYVGAGT